MCVRWCLTTNVIFLLRQNRFKDYNFIAYFIKFWKNPLCVYGTKNNWMLDKTTLSIHWVYMKGFLKNHLSKCQIWTRNTILHLFFIKNCCHHGLDNMFILPSKLNNTDFMKLFQSKVLSCSKISIRILFFESSMML